MMVRTIEASHPPAPQQPIIPRLQHPPHLLRLFLQNRLPLIPLRQLIFRRNAFHSRHLKLSPYPHLAPFVLMRESYLSLTRCQRILARTLEGFWLTFWLIGVSVPMYYAQASSQAVSGYFSRH